jgi:hypothetical protein
MLYWLQKGPIFFSRTNFKTLADQKWSVDRTLGNTGIDAHGGGEEEVRAPHVPFKRLDHKNCKTVKLVQVLLITVNNY